MAQANTYNSITSRRRFLTVAADHGDTYGDSFGVGQASRKVS
jgi:hypothetical protein